MEHGNENGRSKREFVHITFHYSYICIQILIYFMKGVGLSHTIKVIKVIYTSTKHYSDCI